MSTLSREVLQAKRYLVFKDPSYHATLTTASQGTLVCQGGRMSQEEAAEFEQLSNFQVSQARRGREEGGDLNIITAGDTEDEEMGRISEGYKY